MKSAIRFAFGKFIQSAVVATAFLASSTGGFAAGGDQTAPTVHHVILISIDGLHAFDLANYVKSHPSSTLAQLSNTGVTYTDAHQITPTDSFPGMAALATGGSPKTTGLWYDVTYDRALLPAGGASSKPGAVVTYTEDTNIDKNSVNAGGGIDVAKLPVNPSTKQPVWPHSYLRVNTIFEVVKAAGLRTAWADKHPAYDLLNGPSGKGVDDLYTPEIEGKKASKSVPLTEAYDDTKVQAVLNEINGKDHAGTNSVGVPALFGTSLQSVSTAQKVHGYADAKGTPTAPLEDALDHTDQSLGKIVAALKARGLYTDTALVVTAKHGQEPVDPSQRRIVSEDLIPSIVNGVQPGLLAQATQDCGALIWLTDPSKTAAVAAALQARASDIGIEQILSGPALAARYDDPAQDSRTPDLIVITHTGVIIASPTAKKVGEHGGFDENNTHVGLLIEAPGLHGDAVATPVSATQVAPTILSALGLNPDDLQAAKLEGTQPLPGLPFKR